MSKLQYQNKLTKQKVSIIIKWYRVYHKLWNMKLYTLSKIIYHLSRLLFNCVIPPTVELGENVNCGHAMGIIIHQNCKIGKNTLIYQNVTIGRRGDNVEESPIIGENCIIGAGACILGKIIIGNNVKIGANVVVIDDIPSNTTVVCHKPRIIKKRGDSDSE